MPDIKIFGILILLGFLKTQLVLSDAEGDYCYSDEEHPYLLAGTKTAYQVVHGLIENTTVPNCKPSQIWMLIRHGTRNPNKNEIQNMRHDLLDLQRSIIENHEKHGNGTLCQKDLEKLRTWKLDPNLQENKTEFLTKQGQIDLTSLGERFKNYFPELLQSNPVDTLDEKYKFRSTDTQRTIASMGHFITGVFGNVTINNTEVVPSSEDTLLQLYKICKPWLKQLEKPSSSAEVNKFLDGPEYSQIIHNVSQRLGFPHSLPFADIQIMYTACAFENAWYLDERSPWCAAFTEDELKLFEYETDLYYYYHSSYGQDMSPRVGCPPLKDMFYHFSKLENGDTSGEPQGIFYFTHSSSLQLFLAAMGVAKDTTRLTASNYDDMGDRKWSTSHLVPFAGNLAAVFHKCDSANKVRFYLNEKPLDYDGCEMGLCDWEYLKKKMGPNAFNCNIDFCAK